MFFYPIHLSKIGVKNSDYQITATYEETVTKLIYSLLYCQVNKIKKTLFQTFKWAEIKSWPIAWKSYFSLFSDHQYWKILTLITDRRMQILKYLAKIPSRHYFRVVFLSWGRGGLMPQCTLCTLFLE